MAGKASGRPRLDPKICSLSHVRYISHSEMFTWLTSLNSQPEPAIRLVAASMLIQLTGRKIAGTM